MKAPGPLSDDTFEIKPGSSFEQIRTSMRVNVRNPSLPGEGACAGAGKPRYRAVDGSTRLHCSGGHERRHELRPLRRNFSIVNRGVPKRSGGLPAMRLNPKRSYSEIALARKGVVLRYTREQPDAITKLSTC
jgi:hypothetical protein